MKNFNKYLHPTDFDKLWDFHLITVGYNNLIGENAYPTKNHPDNHQFSWNNGRILTGYYIVYISSGSGLFESGVTTPTRIEAGDCFLLFPGIWHRYRPDEGVGWKEYWVGFNGHYPEKLMTSLFDHKSPVIKTKLNPQLLYLFQQLAEAFANATFGYRQLSVGATLQIIGLLAAISSDGRAAKNPLDSAIASVIHALHDRVETQLNIKQLVDEYPVSYSNFRKRFKEITGVSPGQFHLNARLKKAAELLTNTSLRVNEIAYLTGFESVQYFSRIFGKKYGTVPTDYRGNAKNDNSISQ